VSTRRDPIAEGSRNWIDRGCGPIAQVNAATGLTRAQQIVGRRIAHALAEFELTFAQLEVLLALAEAPTPPGMGELGERLRLHPTTAARTVARLEKAQLVERVQDEDARMSRVKVSRRGFELTRASLTRLREHGFGLDGWTEHDIQRFDTLTTPIVAG
jgi:DNA-binding MarR family transcriptional regulator